jgi:hypothetical protein
MRDYDPTTGRYLQADPLGLVDGPSVYGYARQSPVRYTDPRGELIQIAIVGAISNLAIQVALHRLDGKNWEETMRCIDVGKVLIAGFVAGAAGGTPIALALKGQIRTAAAVVATPPIANAVILNRRTPCECRLDLTPDSPIRALAVCRIGSIKIKMHATGNEIEWIWPEQLRCQMKQWLGKWLPYIVFPVMSVVFLILFDYIFKMLSR